MWTEYGGGHCLSRLHWSGVIPRRSAVPTAGWFVSKGPAFRGCGAAAHRSQGWYAKGGGWFAWCRGAWGRARWWHRRAAVHVYPGAHKRSITSPHPLRCVAQTPDFWRALWPFLGISDRRDQTDLPHQHKWKMMPQGSGRGCVEAIDPSPPTPWGVRGRGPYVDLAVSIPYYIPPTSAGKQAGGGVHTPGGVGGGGS